MFDCGLDAVAEECRLCLGVVDAVEDLFGLASEVKAFLVEELA